MHMYIQVSIKSSTVTYINQAFPRFFFSTLQTEKHGIKAQIYKSYVMLVTPCTCTMILPDLTNHNHNR